MDRPIRVQLRRTKGWRMPSNTVSVARPGRLGNPFTKALAIESGYATEETWPEFAVMCFREWLRDGSWWQGPEADRRRAEIIALIPSLRGKNIACFCGLDRCCHGDVYLELANV
ncbi:DUF4326 domain-containing protein [Sphingosinicella ginsenosidimutans]|uniref:DUF4326 domain-containing protein n=1 Tax=Allosphingosinicella ginsenosidimutans TaxID=1176539 RepID=A0A5C6TUZ6_9SPHN|nr:DUF4326 domain-containing protein [Sphingosinicella ginsenosidimutans]TXC63715.1 DUF4326 domain-containing protein [Sphingosinicella ginsenosidimutans]